MQNEFYSIYNLTVTIMAFIISAGGAVTVIVKLYAILHKSDDFKKMKIKEHEEKLKSIDQKLANDYKRIEKIEQSTQLTQEALFALISHALDGNSITELKRSKDRLQDFLIKGGKTDDK